MQRMRETFKYENITAVADVGASHPPRSVLVRFRRKVNSICKAPLGGLGTP